MLQKTDALRCIIYVSEAKIDFDEILLDQLVTKAQEFNEQQGITGYLYFEKGLFLQYIEGKEAEISSLMKRIENDNRHTVVNQCYSDGLTKRRFEKWSMGHLEKQHLIEIRMEHIIMKHMNWLLSNQKVELDQKNRIWLMVEKLSSFHDVLDKFSKQKV